MWPERSGAPSGLKTRTYQSQFAGGSTEGQMGRLHYCPRSAQEEEPADHSIPVVQLGTNIYFPWPAYAFLISVTLSRGLSHSTTTWLLTFEMF